MDSLTLIGDSHFDGWTQEDGQGSTLTSRLGYAYHGKLELMNRSYWGYTTRNQKRRFDEYLQEGRKIRLVIIWLGANDACPPGSSFHVPIHEYRDSITSMIDRLLKSDVTTRIVVMTPSPMADAKTVDIFGNERTNELIGTYRQAALTLKEDIDSAQVAFLDVWPLVDDSALARADLMPDGIHFSVDGGKILFDAVVATVKASWPGFEPAGMKGWYPPPAELNSDDEESLLTKVRTEYQGQFAAGSVNEED